MPFKHNAARRHRILRARYRATNWPAYEASLRRRGDLTLWLDEAALAGWAAPRRSSPGGQRRYSKLAIELVLTLRLVFHLALRQAEAFTSSVLRLLELGMAVPDHTTLSRRGRAFAGRQPRVTASRNPVHLIPAQWPRRCAFWPPDAGPRIAARWPFKQSWPPASRCRIKRAV